MKTSRVAGGVGKMMQVRPNIGNRILKEKLIGIMCIKGHDARMAIARAWQTEDRFGLRVTVYWSRGCF